MLEQCHSLIISLINEISKMQSNRRNFYINFHRIGIDSVFIEYMRLVQKITNVGEGGRMKIEPQMPPSNFSTL